MKSELSLNKDIPEPANLTIITTLSPPAAPAARLNTETLDAIKNKSYQLRPVRKNLPAKKRNLSGSDSDGEQNIGQILARRISMGYNNFEEDNISIKSYTSVRWENRIFICFIF